MQCMCLSSNISNNLINQPSIGGIGRGTLIREIDALGGLMATIADLSAIQFKVLNSSKGAAVQLFY